MTEVPSELPGADLVSAGIDALRRGELTLVEALVTRRRLGARRLRNAGLSLPPGPELPDSPELALYSALGAAHPRDTHSRYNSLIRPAGQLRTRAGSAQSLWSRPSELTWTRQP